MKNDSHHTGFTLIELLVVISIISLLSSIILASVKSAKTKVEDTIITNDVRDYIIALDLYQLDHAGAYPQDPDTSPHCLGNKNPGGICGIAGINTTQSSAINAGLSPYIPSLPSMIYKKIYNNGDLTGYGYAGGGLAGYTLYYIVGVLRNCFGVTLSTDGINHYCYATATNNGATASSTGSGGGS